MMNTDRTRCVPIAWRAAAPAILRVLVALAVVGPATAQGPGSPLANAAWLAGCWAAEQAEPGSGESWTAPAGGTMFGIARTVKGGRTAFYEFLQLRIDGQGRLVLAVQPMGRPPTEFVQAAVDGTALVFENPQHDFPQRISYRQPAPGRLQARIEGERQGTLRGVDFLFQRVPCQGDGAAPVPAAPR